MRSQGEVIDSEFSQELKQGSEHSLVQKRNVIAGEGNGNPLQLSC